MRKRGLGQVASHNYARSNNKGQEINRVQVHACMYMYAVMNMSNAFFTVSTQGCESGTMALNIAQVRLDLRVLEQPNAAP